MAFKICLIGCGYMAVNGHGPSFRKYASLYSDVVLAGCCDVSEERAEAFRSQFGFNCGYTDYKLMLEAEMPDVVIVSVPPQLTAEVSINVIHRGANVLLEKPPGLNRKETAAIQDAAVQAGVSARVAFNRRYMPLVTAMLERIRKDEVRIQHIDYTFMRIGRTDEDFPATAIHGIDTVSYIAGSSYSKADIAYQKMVYEKTGYGGRPAANIFIQAELENGIHASLRFLPVGGCVIERCMITAQEDITFFLELPVWGGYDSPGRLVCLRKGIQEYAISGRDLISEYSLFETNGFYAENAGFFDLLRSNGPAGSDVISGADSVELSDYIRRFASSWHPRV